MKIHRYKPAWRPVGDFLEVVSEPNAVWFANRYSEEGQLFVRYALMQNGKLFFGDGYTVLHHDICQITDGKVTAILIGTLVKYANRDKYNATFIQYFFGKKLEELSDLRIAGALLNKHVDWVNITHKLGYDPFDYDPHTGKPWS